MRIAAASYKTNMILSRFNIWVEDYPYKGGYILFNTLTQALIKVKQDMKDALTGGKDLAQSPFAGDIPALKASGILVESAEEESRKLERFLHQIKHETRHHSFEATILTTYNCNFRCVYCFEEAVRDAVAMDRQTSFLVSAWLKDFLEKNGVKRLFVVYYGGEPLLNIKPIYDISWDLTQWANRAGVKFGCGIITNGSLVNRALVEKLLPVGLKQVRVTVDGDRDAHDKKRPMLGGGRTFDLIMQNIRDVIDLVDVGIAGNFDEENVDSIPRFLDYLEEEGLLHRLGSLNFTPLAPRLGPVENPGAIELAHCLSYFQKHGLYDEMLHIRKMLGERGLQAPSGLAANACSLIMNGGGVTIDPKGIIYKCNSLVGYPDFAVGAVSEKGLNKTFNDFQCLDAWKECDADCPFVPLCQGGCRYFAYLEHKSFSGLYCQREYFRRAVPELVKIEYERLIQQRTKKQENSQPVRA